MHVEDDRAVGTRLVLGFAAQQIKTFAAAEAGLQLAVRRELLAVALQQDL